MLFSFKTEKNQGIVTDLKVGVEFDGSSAFAEASADEGGRKIDLIKNTTESFNQTDITINFDEFAFEFANHNLKIPINE